MLRQVLLGALALALVGCPGFGDEVVALDQAPTWSGEIETLVLRWCGGCHGVPPTSGAPMALVTHAQVLEHLQAVQQQAVLLRRMPPGGLPEPDLSVLAGWIAGGAPGGAPPTWSEVGPLFESGCASGGCHDAAGSARGLDLTRYEGFLAGSEAGPIHGEGDPASSRLIDALRGREGVLRMPLAGPWPEARIAYIEAWIAAGFPEGP